MTNVNNVALGRPKVGGGIYRAPLGTALPTDASTVLPAAFINQGYVSDEGVAREIARSYASIKAWGGDEVANPKTEETIRLNFSLIEANNEEALISAFGEDAVTTDDDVTTLTYRGEEVEDSVWVVDMEYKGKLRRIVFPHAANVTEDFTQEFTDEAVIALPFSLAARRDASEAFFYDHTEEAA